MSGTPQRTHQRRVVKKVGVGARAVCPAWCSAWKAVWCGEARKGAVAYEYVVDPRKTRRNITDGGVRVRAQKEAAAQRALRKTDKSAAPAVQMRACARGVCVCVKGARRARRYARAMRGTRRRTQRAPRMRGVRCVR